MKQVRIRLANVSKSYYSEAAVTQALRKVSLTFCEGEFAVITGESGSGKSTLLNIIGGLDTFDEGELYIDGQPTFQYDEADWEDYRREKIGYVFQDYSLIGHYSALENVMSALLIMGKSREEARRSAGEYLAQVGLAGMENHRASELSSGQKQRLSIARALAKETGIIVADEPTGNLDSETAVAIVKLLAELSKTRLVIMVTHNYDLVEDYATRKIRLHDGEIINDTSNKNEEETAEQKAAEQEAADEPLEALQPEAKKPAAAARVGKRRDILYFARLNRRTDRGRTALFTAFFLVVAVASFFLIGELFYYADDITTKYYAQDVYYQENPTRLCVRHADGSAVTDEEIGEIAAVTDVVAVDSCDLANDVNYYIEKGTDYEIRYGAQRTRGSTKEVYTYNFLNEDHFMRSADCISESDLAAGRLPEALTEIVVYTDDASLLNTQITVFFTANNIWGSGQYCSYTMEIVGILKKDEDQAYFSRAFCQMIASYQNADYLWEYVWSEQQQGYVADERYIMVIAEDLTGDTVRKGGNTVQQQENDAGESDILLHFEGRDARGNADGNAVEIWASVQSQLSDNSAKILEVSEEFFETYYQEESTQASVYITSYAKTDAVTARLERLGYEVVSTYRVSVGDYNAKLANSRLIIIAICVAGLLLLAVAEILILRSLMKLRLKDCRVLRFIGMRLGMLQKICSAELLAGCVTAFVLTVLIMWILRLCRVARIVELMWYVQLPAYLCFVIYNIVVCIFTAAAYNRLLKGRLKA